MVQVMAWAGGRLHPGLPTAQALGTSGEKLVSLAWLRRRESDSVESNGSKNRWRVSAAEGMGTNAGLGTTP